MSDATFMCRCAPVEKILQNKKPILFNTEMTKEILENRKTVTRRVIKPRSPKACGFCVAHNKQDGSVTGVYDCDEHEGMFDAPQKPPYSPGDILYVPEPWKCRKPPNTSTFGYEVVFKDGDIIKFQFADRKRFDKWRKYWDKPDNQWQSPYFMPKEAARIFLRVTDVRVELLQDITVEDAKKEGAFHACSMCIHWHDYCGKTVTMTRDCKIDQIAPEFQRVWDSVIKPKDRALYGWDANPYVWCVSFERISKEEALS